MGFSTMAKSLESLNTRSRKALQPLIQFYPMYKDVFNRWEEFKNAQLQQQGNLQAQHVPPNQWVNDPTYAKIQHGRQTLEQQEKQLRDEAKNLHDSAADPVEKMGRQLIQLKTYIDQCESSNKWSKDKVIKARKAYTTFSGYYKDVDGILTEFSRVYGIIGPDN